MSPLAPSIFLLLQAAADTAGTRVVLEHTWLDTTAAIAQTLVSVLVVAMLVMVVLLLLALKKSLDELGKLIKNAYEPLRAAIAEAREVTGEVRTLAQGLKEPVAKASEAIGEASDRFRSAMDVAEGRLARLDALVDIAQEEAEGVVLGAASLVRGVRAGGAVVGRSLGLLRKGTPSPRRRARGDVTSDELELEEDEVADESFEAASDAEGEDDYDARDDGAGGERDTTDGDTGGARDADARDDDLVEAPRIRPRAGARR